MSEKLNSNSIAMGTTAATSSYEKFDSASRTAMLVSQLSQAIIGDRVDIPHSLHGYELELAKYTTSIKIESNATIVAVIPKYRTGVGAWSIGHNSHKTVIFFDEDKGELDCIAIEEFTKTHDLFAHKLNIESITRQLRPGYTVDADTFLAKTPTITPQGLYTQTVNANIAYLSHPSCIEDGILFSQEFIEECNPWATSRCTAEWGKNWYPRNLYGSRGVFKPIPGPGEKIREDGLVIALCKSDPIFDVIDMLPEMLEIPDLSGHDQLVYVPQSATNAYVYDVDVINSNKDSKNNPLTPLGMEEYVSVFEKQKSRYYENILDAVEAYQRENRKVTLSDRLHVLLKEAYGDEPNSNRSRFFNKNKPAAVKRVTRGVEMDEWAVSINIAWKFKLGYGSKGTGSHGNRPIN